MSPLQEQSASTKFFKKQLEYSSKSKKDSHLINQNKVQISDNSKRKKQPSPFLRKEPQGFNDQTNNVNKTGLKDKNDGQKSKLGHYDKSEIQNEISQTNQYSYKEVKNKINTRTDNSHASNTENDLDKNNTVEFEEQAFKPEKNLNNLTQSYEHFDEDYEVKIRARRAARSRGQSLEIEVCSQDDENDSRFIHNEEIQRMNEDAMELEKSKLSCVDTLDIIDYIKQSVEILMHMRIDEFEMFKNNWNTQEKLRKAQMAHEKEILKAKIRGSDGQLGKKKYETRLFEKVRHELVSNQSSAASIDPMTAPVSQRGFTSSIGKNSQSQIKLDKQALAYEKMLIKLENDIRMHIRVEQQLKLHIEQLQTQTDEVIKDNHQKKINNHNLKQKINDLETLVARAQSGQNQQIQKLEDQIKKLQKQHELNITDQLSKKDKFYKAQIQKLQQELKVTAPTHQQSQKAASYQSDKFITNMVVRSGEQLGPINSQFSEPNDDNYTYTAMGVQPQKTFSGMVGKISIGATMGTHSLGEQNDNNINRYTGLMIGQGLGSKLEVDGLNQAIQHHAPNSATLQKFGRKEKRSMNNQTQIQMAHNRKQQSSSSRVMAIQRKRQTHSQLSNHPPTELYSNFSQINSNTKQRVTQSSGSPPHQIHGFVNSSGQSVAGIVHQDAQLMPSIGQNNVQFVNLQEIHANNATSVSLQNVQSQNKNFSQNKQNSNTQGPPSRSASNQLRAEQTGSSVGQKPQIQNFTQTQQRRRTSKNLNETQAQIVQNFNNTTLAGYISGQSNNNNQAAEFIQEGFGQLGERASHNNSTDDGNAIMNSFFPGTNSMAHQFSEQRSQQLSRGSKRAHHNKIGRRSQTTHEQSHGDQSLGQKAGIEASRIVNATQSVLAPINNSLQSQQNWQQQQQFNQINSLNMGHSKLGDQIPVVSNSIPSNQLTYDQKLLKAQANILDPTSIVGNKKQTTRQNQQLVSQVLNNVQNLHKIYEQQNGNRNIANSPNPSYSKNKSRSGLNSNTRATSKMMIEQTSAMDGRRNSDDIINGSYQQQSLITSQNLPAGTTSNIIEQSINQSNKLSGKQLLGTSAPQSANTATTHFNNKIIINQQHYFTDSIKIYQNGSGNTNLTAGPSVAESGQSNFQSQFLQSSEEPRRMKQGSSQVYPTVQQSIKSSLRGSSGVPNPTVANSSRVNTRRMPGQSGRHSSMHEYLQSNINGLTVNQNQSSVNQGQSQFNQMYSNNTSNFQDLINSSQKVSVPNQHQKKIITQNQQQVNSQQPSKVFQQITAPSSSTHKTQKHLQVNSHTSQKNKRVIAANSRDQNNKSNVLVHANTDQPTQLISVNGPAQTSQPNQSDAKRQSTKNN